MNKGSGREETFAQFAKRVRNNTKRVHKVTGSLGVYDAYKYIRKNKWFNIGRPISENHFYRIIRGVNQLLADNLIQGEDVIFPLRMGALEIRKYDTVIKLNEDGSLYTNMAIDWNATMKLWYEDEESYIKKTLVRIEEKEIFKIYYNRGKANYPNKGYYEFAPLKELKTSLKQSIKSGIVTDALYLSKSINYGSK